MKTFLTSFLLILTFMACVLFSSIAIHLETYSYEKLQMLVRSGIVVALFSAGVTTFLVNKVKKRKENV